MDLDQFIADSRKSAAILRTLAVKYDLAGFSHRKIHLSNARRDPILMGQTHKTIKKNCGP